MPAAHPGARRRRDLSATNYDIRQAFVARYGAGNAALQAACARGDVAVTSCPGNRRWIQLVYDAWLLMPTGTVSMVDARDAMLAADQLRFNGVNQDILWNAFAKRGLGQDRAGEPSLPLWRNSFGPAGCQKRYFTLEGGGLFRPLASRFLFGFRN